MKKLNLFICITILFIFLGCDNFIDSTSINQKRSFSSNYKYYQQLEKIENIVDINFLRKIVILELSQTIFDDFDIDSFSISEIPFFIFNKNGTLYRIEFSILSKNKVIGTVVSNFRENEGSAVVCCLPFKRKYLNEKSYSFLVAGEEYPFKIELKPNLKVNLDMTPQNYNDKFFRELCKLKNDDIKCGDLEIVKKEYLAEVENRKKENIKYWEDLNKRKKDILASKDIVVKKSVSYSKNRWSKILPAYNYQDLRKTCWRGPCVPTAMAWAYRGIYSSFAGKHINVSVNTYYDYLYYDYSSSYTRQKILLNSAKNDGGLFYHLCDKGYVFNHKSGYVTGNRYNNMMKFVTNDDYTTWYTALRSDARKNIRYRNMAVLLTSHVNGGYHCLVAFGVRSVGINKYQYLVKDNTYQVSNYTGGIWMSDHAFLVGGYKLEKNW